VSSLSIVEGGATLHVRGADTRLQPASRRARAGSSCSATARPSPSSSTRAGSPSPSAGPAVLDPQKDPLTEKAVRRDSTWLFTPWRATSSRIDVSGAALAIGERWPLSDDADRQAWARRRRSRRARASGRLYVLVHQGVPDTHKQAGTRCGYMTSPRAGACSAPDAEPAELHATGRSPQPLALACRCRTPASTTSR
jgi:hypothetical protein